MMNIVNGGVHADNPIDIQKFMIVPVGADLIADAIRTGSEIFPPCAASSTTPASIPMSATRAVSRPICPRRKRRSASS